MQRILILLIAAFFLGMSYSEGRAAEQKPASVSWAFVTRTDSDGTPRSRVSLRVGSRSILVAARLAGEFQVVPRQEYRTRHVPVAAEAACTGWWAGQGQDFYAIRRHGHWEVFRRDLDEEAPTSRYRRVRLTGAAPEGDRARRREDQPHLDTRH